MRGLLIKDFFCLKKHIINYIFVIVGVVVISISYVLSFNNGNIHIEIAKLVESGESSQAEVMRLANISILLFMLIPFVAAGDAVISLIHDDEKAGFYKVASAMPVSIAKRVMSRFVTAYIFIAVSAVIDFLMIIVISLFTNIVSFGGFCGVIITFFSTMAIYISLFVLFIYLLGKRSVAHAEIIPLLIGVATYVLSNFGKLRAFIAGDESVIADMYNGVMEFMFNKSYIIFIFAVVISAAAYFMAVHMAKRKRGVV